MTYHTRYEIGDRVRAKDPNTPAQDFTIGQTRIVTLCDEPNRYYVEQRSVARDPKRGWVYGKWYAERWILGRINDLV